MREIRRESVCQVLLNTVRNKINYFGDNSCLHGVGKVFSLSHIPTVKRLFWLLMLILCSWGAARILMGSLALYSAGVVSFSIETDYLEWDTPFPAVTVCEPSDTKRIDAFLASQNLSLNLKNFYKEINFWQSKFCSTCTTCKYNETCLSGDIGDVVRKYRYNCTSMLKDCWWDNKYFNCCDKFHPIETEYGTCYVYNSRLLDNETTFNQVNRQVGLPYLVISAVQNVVLRVHSPHDLVTVMSENILGISSIPLVTNFEVILQAEQTISDPSIQPLPPSSRGCLFGWEKPPGAEHWPFRKYTYNACVWYCRAMAQYAACGCSHHFVPRMDNIPRCGVEGLGCLHLSKEAAKTDCVCPMDCDDVIYKTIHVFNVRKPKTKELLERGSRAIVKLAHLPALRVRRHAIRDDVTFVVDIGGVGGVFFGASVLSVLEIVYLFCIRQNRKWRKNYWWKYRHGRVMAERRWKLLILVTLFIQSHCLINELSNTESKDNSTASLQCSLLPRCSMPCAGAPPPRVCPAVVPKCKYGCACYTYCENGVPVLNDCFKTRDCIGKVSRSPPTILSKNKIGYTSKIYSEKTEVDHNEIPKYTSIPRRNAWFKFGLKGTPISALRPKAQRISEIKSNHANRNFTNYELEENAAAETIKIKAPRLINYEIQAHRSRPEISPSTCCSQEHIHNVGQKVSGRRGWIQKKYFVRKNVTFEGTFQNLAPTHNSLIRRTLPPKYLKNAFTDKIQVSNKRNSVGIWSPSKPTQRNDYSAINRVIHTNHCTIDGVQTEHSRRVRKNLYNHTWGPSKNKNVTMSQQIFTPSVYSYRILMRQGGPQSFNYGLRRQSFNSQHGRRYLGGILPKFNIANQAGSDQRIDKIIVQNMHIQRHHPKFIGSENQDDLVAWKKVKIHTPDRVTSPSTNIETDSNKESNKMLRVSIDQKLTPTTMPPRLMGGNQGNVVRYRNHAHDSNRIVPAQYHDPRTLRPNNENDLKIRPQSHEIIGQNDDERIKYSNNGIDPRIESINNRSVQNRNLILIPPGINAEFHPKVEDYSPITPARKRYKTRPPNQEFQSSRRIQPSNKGSKNNLQPVEGFRSDTDTDTDMVARAFLSK